VAEAASPPKDFLSIADWSRSAIEAILARARDLKRLRAEGVAVRSLAGRSVLLYFEKPSLRTYVTFGVGVSELGGVPVYLPPGQVGIGEREAVEDVARNLSRWVHAVVARTFSHRLLEDLARFGSVPVINALSDRLHPCQAMADALTIAECADLARSRLVYLGDGNNVAHSLIHLAGVLGMRLTLCTPPEYAPLPEIVERGRALASRSGGEIRLEHDPRAAVKDARFLYTDVWASMGQEHESERRGRVFRPYQLNEALLAAAPGDCEILHCLPAHRGEEITDAVLESPRSRVFEQAENRLHAQKAILEALVR
jgi:ornithine carbamoyltransferase